MYCRDVQVRIKTLCSYTARFSVLLHVESLKSCKRYMNRYNVLKNYLLFLFIYFIFSFVSLTVSLKRFNIDLSSACSATND